MQLHLVSIRVAHLGNFLTSCNGLAIFDEQLVVMRVNRYERLTVLDHDELAHAAHARSAEDHTARCACEHRLSSLTCDVDALAGRSIERGKNLSFHRPSPTDVFGRPRGFWTCVNFGFGPRFCTYGVGTYR